MKLLIGELKADEGIGEVWVHHNLRLAYIAQHSMHHLEESVNNTPLEYLQNRFYQGRDREIAKRSSHNLSKKNLLFPGSGVIYARSLAVKNVGNTCSTSVEGLEEMIMTQIGNAYLT